MNLTRNIESVRLIMKIAWRNILRHRGKSIIIGVILFLAALLMTIGNGVVRGMDRGLEQNIVNGFLGNAVIISTKEKSDNILFKLYGEAVQEIGNYKDIKAALSGADYLEGMLPVGKNITMVINEEDGEPGYTYVMGVDFAEYRRFFPDSFSAIEGRLLNPGEEGILIPTHSRNEIFDNMGVWYIPEGGSLVPEHLPEHVQKETETLSIKSNAVFMGFNEGNSTSDVRLTVRGILRYRALNTLWGHFAIMDIENYRRALGYFTAEETVVIDESRKKILEMQTEDLDSMFGSESMLLDSAPAAQPADLARTELATSTADVESGSYNLVLIKFKKGADPDSSLARINETLTKANLGVRAISWKKAAGPIGNMATIIGLALHAFVLFLFFVAIIIIVNTLTMTTLERTPEIGMMRAIGAHKSFIAGMFFGETGTLAGLFGGAGMILGIIIITIIPSLGITTDNDMIQLLYGGDVFRPYLGITDIIIGIIELTAVVFITVIYPIFVARSITPLDAISRD